MPQRKCRCRHLTSPTGQAQGPPSPMASPRAVGVSGGRQQNVLHPPPLVANLKPARCRHRCPRTCAHSLPPRAHGAGAPQRRSRIPSSSSTSCGAHSGDRPQGKKRVIPVRSGGKTGASAVRSGGDRGCSRGKKGAHRYFADAIMRADFRLNPRWRPRKPRFPPRAAPHHPPAPADRQVRAAFASRFAGGSAETLAVRAPAVLATQRERASVPGLRERSG